MSAEHQALLGQHLATARRNQQQVAPEPYDLLATVSDAYRVQQHAIAARNEVQTGYKIGATNAAVQKMFNTDSPFYGPLFDCDHLRSGTTVPNSPALVGGEAEFAFRCGADFPADHDLKAEDLPALISGCCIAVEIVGRRLQGSGLQSLHGAIADFGANAGFITGDSIADWATRDLSTIRVTASVNGTETNNGTGAAVLGNPLNAILWLHNSLSDRGQHLKAGDWISTGTCLGVIAPVAGSQVDVDFSGCGSITYQISA